MASAERLSTASSHSTPAATRFTLSTGEYSSCTHTHIGASQQEGPGFDFHMGRCWYWGGRFSPGLQCSGGLSPGPFYVEFTCSPRVHKGFPPLRTPTEKHAEEQNTCPSLTKDGQFTSLGPLVLQAAHFSWGVDRESVVY